ncbi:MAG: hypothetical protein MJZ57_04245 [Bacteroidales bacterium]|nr:hypothetical protein [Bacteroidales bacterium]
MKKTVFTVLLAMALTAVFAQTEEEPDWRMELPRHEFGVGIGDPAIALLYRPSIFELPYDAYTPDDWFLDNKYYHGAYYATCPLTFHYMYRVAKFLWLGFDFSYMGVYAKRYGAADDVQIGWMNEHYLTLMPKIRFSYFNRKYLTMYSGISTGVTVGLIESESPAGFMSVRVRPAVQATFYGISVGKNWYGFAEVGCGYNGFIRTGFGCHFNKKQSSNQ